MGVDLKTDNKIAWGKKVSLEFKEKVIEICINLKINPDFFDVMHDFWDRWDFFS